MEIFYVYMGVTKLIGQQDLLVKSTPILLSTPLYTVSDAWKACSDSFLITYL